MKIYKPPPRSRRSNEIDLGFDRKDSKLLAADENYNTPIQIFAKTKPQHFTKLDEKQYCSNCRSELILLEKTQMLLCKGCGNTFSIMNSSPLLETNQELRPFGTQIDDPNSTDRPFAVGLVVDSDPPEPDWEVTQSSGEGGRIQHIKLKRGVSPTSYRIKPD
jgi:hypothetical protein